MKGWGGLRVAVVGAAREGTAVARYLAARGAHVTLSDAKPREALGDRLETLAGLDIALALGGMALDLPSYDLLFVSPGVPPTAPVVVRARALGLPITSETRLLTQVCGAPVVGITGSSGKTTTTSLVGRMFQAQGCEAWVGGNIGIPLTERLLDDGCPAAVVLELSSFQLELYSPLYQGPEVDARRSTASRVLSVEGWSPHVAAVTNVTPNHLDRHPTMADYVAAKRNIVAYQRLDDWAVLNADDPISHDMQLHTLARPLSFSLLQAVEEGAYLGGERLWLRLDGRERALCEVGEVRLRGRHNLANVLCAACCAMAMGVPSEAMRQAIREFSGVSHRLEVVRVLGGVTYVNDSIATSPERAVAALRSYSEPVVLLAGGRDKHLSWDAWADLALRRARLVVAFGEAAPIVEGALRAAQLRAAQSRAAQSRAAQSRAAQSRAGEQPNGSAELRQVQSLAEAVEVAAREARPGDVVLLSPGGTSFDAFVDYEARGQAFRELVYRLAGGE